MPVAPKFAQPITSKRPYGCRRYDVFSPKLGRALTLFGRDALELWTTLEASPSIDSYCERPVLLPVKKSKRPVDFWVCSKQQTEEFIVMRRQSDDLDQDLANIDGIKVRYLYADELNLHQVALQNWGRIIRDLSAFARYIPANLPSAIAASLTGTVRIEDLQRNFATHDPDAVQIAVFLLLHRGDVKCPEITEKPLSSQLRVEPVCPPTTT